VIVAPPALREMAEATGHPFTGGGEPDEAEIAPIRERLPVVSPQEAAVLGNRELFGRLAATAMLPAVVEVVDRWQPDLVLREPCEYASAVVAADRDTPIAQIAISLAEAEWGSIAAAQPALEHHRPGLTDVVRATPYVTRFPAAIDASPFPSTIRVRETSDATGPLPRWWGSDDRPLVYVTLGTVIGHMTRAADTFRVLIDAVAGLDARVLVTVGRNVDPDELGPIPAGVHVEQWVEQADALAETEVVVCHGGSGTTLGALAAGVPLVLVPQFADQFVNAERVVGLGAAVAVEPRAGDDGRRLPLLGDDAPRIRAAIDAVRGNPAYRRAAERMGASMASTPRADEILDALLTRSPRG
jgi:hypothetical protein